MATTSLFRPAMRSFESQLREYRDETGITFQDLADRMGVSATYISQILKRGVSLEQLERIAKALELPPEDFDAYHLLSLERNYKGGDPLAHQYVKLMVRLAKLPENKRAAFMDETLKAAARAR
jgi:transcriptional regulator with XRE-family HTH domain